MIRPSLAVSFLFTLLACKASSESRCAHCGMKIEANSAFRAEIAPPSGAPLVFDTPRCAILSFRADAGPAAKIRVQEFYDRSFQDASELRFVVGSDVLGPMGPDYIPVSPPITPKFLKDHAGERVLTLSEIRGDEWKTAP